jgi:serpin B
MYLINAVYFKSDWAEQFDKADTRDGQFFAPASEITSEFMYKTGKVKDISDSDIIGVALPYKDTDFVFFALMPADRQVTPRQWLANQSSDLFSELGLRISSGSDENSINLGMPKFEAEYEDSLKNDLSAMGMEIAFDPDRADFSGMQKSAERNLYIGEVKHKTYIKVDEKGTEAAAATSVEMRVTSAPIVDKDIIFDRPFIYGVMHMPSGTPLFAGIMENPSQN